MQATFRYPDGSEITSGGTTDLNCRPDYVESAIRQVYNDVWESNKMDAEKLPVPYYTHTNHVKLKDDGGQQYILLEPYNHVA